MPNPYFQFKQFTVWHNKCAMKVGTDGVLLGAWVKIENALSILDIGTGTGLIALMLAQKTNAVIDAIEIDGDAFSQAGENVNMSPWVKQIKVFHASFQNFVASTDNKYDLIVSNPPYFKNSLKAFDNRRTIARHNDILPYSTLIQGVANLLAKNGRFCVVLPYVEAQLFEVDAALCHLYCSKKTIIKPVANKTANRVLMEFSKMRDAVEDTLLSIMDIYGEYTAEYKQLTKDYYLNF